LSERRLALDGGGVLDTARQIPSPNADERPDPEDVSLVVIHAISLPPGEFGGGHVERLFTNRLDPAAHPYFAGIAGLRVSAHFLIGREGDVVQFVPCRRRAWHAGESSYAGRAACNDYSVGVELEGTGEIPFEDAQYDSLARLAAAIGDRYPIGAYAGHEHVAPGRKRDPGPSFEWDRLFGSIGRGYDGRG